MKKNILTLLLFFAGIFLYAQSPIGFWKTIDDETGKEKSIVEIYEVDKGKLEGKVIKILTPGKENATCVDCKGDKKDKPITGMIILWDLEESGDNWKGGKILDPNNGKTYKCKMNLKDENTLDVRGFLGISLLGRTQTWYRMD